MRIFFPSLLLVLLSHLNGVRSSPSPILQDPIWAQQEATGTEVMTRICDTLGEGDCGKNVAPYIEKSRARYCQMKLAEVEPCLTEDLRKYGTEECKKRLIAYDGCSAYM